MDKGEYENELKQVLGDTRAAFDITQCGKSYPNLMLITLTLPCRYDTLVFGDNGLLLAGPNSRTYEPLLVSYLQVRATAGH